MNRKTPPTRILFIAANRLGDAVLACGALDQLIQQTDNPAITIISGPIPAPIYRGLPGLVKTIALSKQRYGKHWWYLWQKTVGTSWDLVVDLRGSALAWTLLTKKRLVSGKAPVALHRVEYWGKLFGFSTPPTPILWPLPQDWQRAAELLPLDGPVLAVGPAANWRGKQWRGEKFAEMVLKLTSHPSSPLARARVAVMAASHERQQCLPVLETVPKSRLIDLVGKTDPLEAYTCLQRCALFIGNDSGLMHLAAAAKIPTLGLFGPSRTEHYRPWGNRCVALRTPARYEELIGASDYDHRTTDTLMDGLSVELVAQTALELLSHHAGVIPKPC